MLAWIFYKVLFRREDFLIQESFCSQIIYLNKIVVYPNKSMCVFWLLFFPFSAFSYMARLEVLKNRPLSSLESLYVLREILNKEDQKLIEETYSKLRNEFSQVVNEKINKQKK